MSTGKVSSKGKSSKLVTVMYVAAALMAALFIYMAVTAVTYINNYAASYGLGFSDMLGDGIQYVLSSSVNYLVYGLILFALGKILDTLQKGKCEAAEEVPALSAGIITGEEKAAEMPELQQFEEPEVKEEEEEEAEAEAEAAESEEAEKETSEEKDA